MPETTVRRLRIVLADDHATVRQGLRLLIDAQPDLKVVAEAADGKAVLQLAQELDPDVVVMDISMPGTSGLTATRVLKEARPHAAIVVLTRHADDAYLHEMLRAGAAAFVLKQSPSTELIQAIRAAAAGGQYLDANVTSRVTGGLLARNSKKAGPRLTDREAEVLRMIARGYSNKEIASQLDLSVKTIEVHKANGMRKLGLRGRIDIVRFAIVQGWLGEGGR
jgi:two-component system, NarL family, response regulator NreC